MSFWHLGGGPPSMHLVVSMPHMSHTASVSHRQRSHTKVSHFFQPDFCSLSWFSQSEWCWCASVGFCCLLCLCEFDTLIASDLPAFCLPKVGLVTRLPGPSSPFFCLKDGVSQACFVRFPCLRWCCRWFFYGPPIFQKSRVPVWVRYPRLCAVNGL